MGKASACPQCQRSFKLTPEMYDRMLSCPWCGHLFCIPAPKDAVETAASERKPAASPPRRPDARIINALMLAATLLWAGLFALTGVWALLHAHAESQLAPQLGGAGGVSMAIRPFFAILGLETLAYAALLVPLWALRKNTRA
ncbi:MAG TPA: hypothetical protein VMV10_29385 [Pirellulales bacterium]|nr:hypothetical protein [Pirellulales bacterium]